MKIQKKIQVELAQNKHQRPVDLVQYDTGVQLVVTVTDFEVPTGTTATLYVQKPSGKFVYQETGITISGNVITVNLENQALTEHGETGYQLRLMNGSDRITTFTGILNVQKSLADAGAVESSTVIAAFEAKTAEQIAEIQAEADAQIERIQNQFNIFATKTEAANAIKGNLSGAVVVADDVSPVEHNPVVNVGGKNKSKSFVSNADAGGYRTALYVECDLQPDTIYTLSFVGASGNSVYFNEYISTEYLWIKCNGGRQSITFKTKAEWSNEHHTSNGWIILKNNDGNTVVPSFADVQIEKGDTATEYEPYIDPTTVEVTRAGRSIFSKASQSVSGENKAWASLLVVAVKCPPGDYVASCRFKQIGTDKATVAMSIRTFNDYTVPFGDASSAETDGNLLKQFTVTPGSGGFQIYLYSNTLSTALTTECVFENICVEVGTESKGYEIYEGKKFTPNADGTVSGITSLSPYMTILTDTEGVTVECEYNVDLKTYIDKRIAEMMQS